MKNNCLTPWAHIKWRLWHVLSKGCRSLTAPRSKVIVSLPMVVYPCLSHLFVHLWLVASEEEGLWRRRGMANYIRWDGAQGGRGGDNFRLTVPPPLPFSFINLSRLSSICPASSRLQSSSSLDTLVAMSLKAKGAPHRRLNLTPLLWPSPLGSWQTSASNATRAPAAPWVQDRRKGPARWTWQPQPCAASRSASTTSAGSRGLRTLTSQPHRGVRGSAAFWCPDRWRLEEEGWCKQRIHEKR